jgi:hypothetical protein
MRPQGQTEQVRCLVRSLFVELGAGATEPARETILIRDGHYCGRRFELDGLAAVWFAEEGQVKMYGRDGRVMKVCSASELAPAQRGAA